MDLSKIYHSDEHFMNVCGFPFSDGRNTYGKWGIEHNIPNFMEMGQDLDNILTWWGFGGIIPPKGGQGMNLEKFTTGFRF